jgi:GntR family transcriptional regulator
MHRTSFSGTGQPCEHMRIHIIPDRYSFKLSLPGPLEIARALQPTTA